MNLRYFFILNPGSRGGRSRRHFGTLMHVLKDEQVDYEAKVTSNLDDACAFSRQANLDGFDVITAVGGDGTINRVLNGFYDEHGKRISRAAFAVLYTGTSPDFCRSYGIPVDFGDALNVLFSGLTRKAPVGKIRYAPRFLPEYENRTVDDSGNFKTGYFACCANIGIGASVARYANSGIRKIAGDGAGTFAALIRSLIAYRPSDFRIVRDGREQTISRMHSLSAGLTPYIASGIRVASGLEDGDSRFYNLEVSGMKLKDVPATLRAVYSGKKINGKSGACSLSYSRLLDVCGNGRNPEIEFDGDPAGFLPCRVEAAAEPLDVITGIP